jgi:hypothetical protein
MDQNTEFDDAVPLLSGDWFDPLEVGVRQRIYSFIEQMLESELEAVWQIRDMVRQQHEKNRPDAATQGR